MPASARGESLHGAGEQRPVVGLQLQGVVAPLGADLPGHARVAMQGVGGDDAAFQRHGFERRQGRRHFVAARRMAARQRQARLGVPNADHQRGHEGAAALLSRAASSCRRRPRRLWPEEARVRRATPCETFANASVISAGSSRRKRRLKLSWLGAPCGRSTICANSASLAAAKSAMSTQVLAPHRVAASAMNSIAAKSCRALKSRGSRTSRKTVIKVRKTGSPRIRKPLQNQLLLRTQQPSTHPRFPWP